MQKQSLSKLFSGNVFVVPDYQRGYAWERKQWKDFVEDVDALVTDAHVSVHYTGTIVTYNPPGEKVNYSRRAVNRVDLVDGQQRLTTCCLYLSVIIRALVAAGQSEYTQDIAEFLYHDAQCKLQLNNDTEDLFYQLLESGAPRKNPNTDHQIRLCRAIEYFSEHVQGQLGREGDVEYLREVFEAITSKMVFTYYEIEEECEIGMTFELMNSRGKGLSVMELLKNYLLHWVSRNGGDADERSALTRRINSAWKDVYWNLGPGRGNEAQCLRVAWVLYCHYLPKYWRGYEGFKEREYIPLRDFSFKSQETTKEFLVRFVNGFADVSVSYASVINPEEDAESTQVERDWLSRIRNAGNMANFLPLLVAVKERRRKGEISENGYLDLLRAIECFCYRVFLFEGKRSTTGKSALYRWARELFDASLRLDEVTSRMYDLIAFYSKKSKFVTAIEEPSDWYSCRNLVKYTLFEYEKHLLAEKGKGEIPRIRWADLAADSTIEHILPQTIGDGSTWSKHWGKDAISIYLHDIGNLVLTRNNSNYLNFDFSRKKGKVGVSPSYSDSHLSQERVIAQYDEWTPTSLLSRRAVLTEWMIDRWGSDGGKGQVEVDESADEDELEPETAL